MTRQKGKQAELGAKRADLDPVPLAPGAEQGQARCRPPRAGWAVPARIAQVRADPSRELVEGEWLCHVVGRPRIEAANAILDLRRER